MMVDTLDNIANIIMGQSPPSSSYNQLGLGLPFFQGKADFGDLYPTVRVFCSAPGKIAQPGDILISVRAPVGPTNISPQKSCIGRGLAAIRAREGVDEKYLLYFLRFYEPQLVHVGTGSTFEAISRDDLEQVPVPLVPLPEQKRIAAILDKADRLRRLRRCALHLSDTYLQSVFLGMFGDPATNPMSWETGTLGDVIISAKDGPHVSPQYTESGVPFLSTRNIRRGEIIWDDLKFISRTEAANQWRNQDCKPQRGDILYTKGGTTGLAKTVDFDREVAVWVHIAVLKLRRDRVVPLWLENMLNCDYCYRQSQELTFGIVNRDLGLKRMPRIKIFIPPLPPQNEFTQIALKLGRLRGQQREAERQAEHLFQTLLHRAFRGELGAGAEDVSEAVTRVGPSGLAPGGDGLGERAAVEVLRQARLPLD